MSTAIYRRLVDRLLGMDPLQRRIGKTRTAIDLAKRVDGVLVVMNQEQARAIAGETGLRTLSVRTAEVDGFRAPIICHQDALVLALDDTLRQLAKTEHAKARMRDRVISALRQVIHELEDEE